MNKHAKLLFYYILLIVLIAMIANAERIVTAGNPQMKRVIREVRPQRVYAQSVTPTPIPTKQDIINKYPHSDILTRIWTLETTKGQAVNGYHRGCERKGLSNEFGYGVYSKICFDTFEDSVKSVSLWFTKRLKSHTLAETLCIYNIGKDTNTCKYAQDFLNH